MPSIGYSAPPDTEVSFVDDQGRTHHVRFDSNGSYTATKANEIEVLDGLAELKQHPISFSPKAKKE